MHAYSEDSQPKSQERGPRYQSTDAEGVQAPNKLGVTCRVEYCTVDTDNCKSQPLNNLTKKKLQQVHSLANTEVG